MTRLRRASATVALCLLASAMTACAECAWVLWEISSPTPRNPDRTYDKIDAEATNEACKQRAEVAIQRRTLQARLYGWTVTRGDGNRVPSSWTSSVGPTPWTRAGRRSRQRVPR